MTLDGNISAWMSLEKTGQVGEIVQRRRVLCMEGQDGRESLST